MSKTVQDVIDRVQRSFGDEAGVQITTDDIIRWTNDAQRVAVMQHENLLQTTSYVSSVVGQGEYSLPADLLTIDSIHFKQSYTDPTASTYSLRYISAAELDELADGYDGTNYSAGVPVVFSRGSTEGKFVVFPRPDTAVTNGFKITYARYPVDVTGTTSTIDLPDYYFDYVIQYCMLQAYELDEDWLAYDKKAGQVQSNLDFNNNREGWFGRDTYPVVTTRFEDTI